MIIFNAIYIGFIVLVHESVFVSSKKFRSNHNESHIHQIKAHLINSYY